MNNIELKDTMELMVSENYKDRFKAEYYQLKIRCENLHKTIIKNKAGTLDFELNCSAELLETQLYNMEQYLEILEIRAEIEKIEL